MTARLVKMLRVAGDMVARSLPAISGAAITAQRLNWLWYSESLIPPLPISSMSGSFQPPGPRSSWLTLWVKFHTMLGYESWISDVVRHMLARTRVELLGRSLAGLLRSR